MYASANDLCPGEVEDEKSQHYPPNNTWGPDCYHVPVNHHNISPPPWQLSPWHHPGRLYNGDGNPRPFGGSLNTMNQCSFCPRTYFQNGHQPNDSPSVYPHPPPYPASHGPVYYPFQYHGHSDHYMPTPMVYPGPGPNLYHPYLHAYHWQYNFPGYKGFHDSVNDSDPSAVQLPSGLLSEHDEQGEAIMEVNGGCELVSVKTGNKDKSNHSITGSSESGTIFFDESKRRTADDNQPVLSPDELTETESLSGHLLRAFEREEFTDARILLTSSRNLFYPITFRLHSVVVARSSVLKSLLKRGGCHEQMNPINAIAGEYFCLVRAFEAAIQNLYGMPLINRRQLKRLALQALGYGNEVQLESSRNKEATIDFALCYAVSGAFLCHRDIVRTGMRLAIELIDWDTVELALHFGLCAADFVVSYDFSSSEPCNRDSHKAENDNTPSDVRSESDHDTMNSELRTEWAPTVVTTVLHFVINTLDLKFKLDSMAHTNLMADRIPAELRSVPGSIKFNPKLASLKFGSLGSLNEQKPSRECSIVSAILISLPFMQLQEAFDIMRKKQLMTMALAQDIICERENRRLRALQVYAKEHPNQKEQEYPEYLNELGFAEYITSNNISYVDGQRVLVKFSFRREWKGCQVLTATPVNHKDLVQ